jgi:hypothetical protein
LGQGSLFGYSPINTPLHFGDYNGDGKVDFMYPENNFNGYANSSIWTIAYSNPPINRSNQFFNFITNYIIPYQPEEPTTTPGTTYNRYLPIDANKDGKTDLVRIQIENYNDWTFWGGDDIKSRFTLFEYIKTATGFVLDYSSPYIENQSPVLPMPIGIDQRLGFMNEDIVLARQGQYNASWDQYTYVNLTKDCSRDKRLKKVTSSGGSIVDEIEYNDMFPTIAVTDQTSKLTGFPSGFYSSTNDAQTPEYPNAEIKQISKLKLVSRIKNTVLGILCTEDTMPILPDLVLLDSNRLLDLVGITQQTRKKLG